MTMLPVDAAALFHGREYPIRPTREELSALKAARLVVITGHSDDIPSLFGSITEEAERFSFWIRRNGSISYEGGSPGAGIKATFGEGGSDSDPAWTFTTDVPHSSFMVMEDGLPFSQGLVICLDDIHEAVLSQTSDGMTLVMNGRRILAADIREPAARAAIRILSAELAKAQDFHFQDYSDAP